MYSTTMFKEINKFIHKELEYYDDIQPNDIIKVDVFVKKINKENKISFTLDDIINMRNVYIYLLAKSKGVLTLRLGSIILNMYNEGNTLIEIANKLKIPPINVFYQIMIENGQELDKKISKKDIPKDIKLQLVEIQTKDISKWFNTIPDNNVKQKIKELKCKHYTKQEIRKLGKHPDILFIDGCTYKDITFNWIVFKPYILYDNHLLLHDIQKNINKFQRFGKGLILYTNIYCSNYFIHKLKVHVNIYSFFD